MKTPLELSLALQEANDRLLALRPPQDSDAHPQREGGVSAVSLSPASAERTLAELPAHLGWHSQAVSQHVRGRGTGRQEDKETGGQEASDESSKRGGVEKSEIQNPQSEIVIYPSLALAMLREGQVSAGRLWWLCRHLDTQGQGVLRIAKLRQQFADKDAPLRLCGWRRVRQILAEGEGVFWTRDKERLWLRSAVKVADILGVEKFQGKVVEMPASILCQSIGKVRAHFYATFHASRTTKHTHIKTHPIARQTLETITGVGRRTQQAYEENAGISVQQNIAFGNPKSKTQNPKSKIATHGTAYFELKDYHGHHGKRGAMYMAWQLPNSYTAPHIPNGRGRQKYLNRHLNDLRMKREAGNRQESADGICRRYFKDGVSADKARDTSTDRYWQAGQYQSGKGQWYEMPAFAPSSTKGCG